MKTKITEVARFVESLEENSLVSGQKSVLLEGDLPENTGGANTLCVNQVPICTNHSGGCPNPTNPGITDCAINLNCGGPTLPLNPSCGPTNKVPCYSINWSCPIDGRV